MERVETTSMTSGKMKALQHLLDIFVAPREFFRWLTISFRTLGKPAKLITTITSFLVPFVLMVNIWIFWGNFESFHSATAITASFPWKGLFYMGGIYIFFQFFLMLATPGFKYSRKTRAHLKQNPSNFLKTPACMPFTLLNFTRRNLVLFPSAFTLSILTILDAVVEGGIMQQNGNFIGQQWNVYNLGWFLYILVGFMTAWTAIFHASSVMSLGMEYSDRVPTRVSKVKVAWHFLFWIIFTVAWHVMLEVFFTLNKSPDPSLTVTLVRLVVWFNGN